MTRPSMVWCRKVWRSVASVRCETCPDAVEVQRQILCGRQPGTPPDPEAVAELERPQKRRPAQQARPQPELPKHRGVVNVRMRDKRPTPAGEAVGQQVATEPEQASGPEACVTNTSPSTPVAAREKSDGAAHRRQHRRLRRPTSRGAAESTPDQPSPSGAPDTGAQSETPQRLTQAAGNRRDRRRRARRSGGQRPGRGSTGGAESATSDPSAL